MHKVNGPITDRVPNTKSNAFWGHFYIKDVRILSLGYFCWILLDFRYIVEKTTLNFLQFFIYSFTT